MPFSPWEVLLIIDIAFPGTCHASKNWIGEVWLGIAPFSLWPRRCLLRSFVVSLPSESLNARAPHNEEECARERRGTANPHWSPQHYQLVLHERVPQIGAAREWVSWAILSSQGPPASEATPSSLPLPPQDTAFARALLCEPTRLAVEQAFREVLSEDQAALTGAQPVSRLPLPLSFLCAGTMPLNKQGGGD